MGSLAEAVLPIIRQTRALTLPDFGTAEVTHRKSDGAHDVVTKLDLAVEKFLSEKLREIDPDAGFTGEEYGGETKDTFWICDPIDGTAHYVRGLPFCTTMLARIERGIVTFGAIYDFVHDDLYHAERGGGAFCNGEPIHVSERTLSEAYISWESHIEKPENLATYLKLRERSEFVKFMCCGYEFAMIASGKLDGRVLFDPYGHDWDYAAGPLIIEEAGGAAANLGMRTYDYRNHDFIAANKHVFTELTQGPDAIFPIRETKTI